jgi:hypothetical protein
MIFRRQFKLSIHSHQAWSAAQALLLHEVRGAMSARCERRTIRLTCAWRSRSSLCWRSFEFGNSNRVVVAFQFRDHVTRARPDTDARQFRDIFSANLPPFICRLRSSSHLREGIIPIGLGLRPTERERFGPMACARIETFDPLHAGGFRLCARF